MTAFQPDFNNIVDCAENRHPKRIPLYEHQIAPIHMERLLGYRFEKRAEGERPDCDGFMRGYCDFFLKAGYDTVSYEAQIVPILPFGGALTNRGSGYITSRDKLDGYPFEAVEADFRRIYEPFLDALRANLPEGMKAVGGCGYGLLEIVHDLVGFENLCMMQFDDPELYSDVYSRCGDMFLRLWQWMTDNYSDVFCVFRFGDDLGFKQNTMLSPQDIRQHLIPQYKRVIELVHGKDRPFLLHSCGCIFNVMDDLINIGIDAKHSNEDAIADMSVWVEKYGDRIGNFGGVDTDHLSRTDDESLCAEVARLYEMADAKNGGFALGSGNSIPDYSDYGKYMLMINTVRRLRGEKI